MPNKRRLYADPAAIDTLTLSLVEAQEGLELGLFTSETLATAFLAQIDEFEPLLNAFTFRNPGALDAVCCRSGVIPRVLSCGK